MFDPLFFNISPIEAELMDPQERLFLQCAHEAIEDAGYSKESLVKKHNQNGDGNVGVFVGAMFEEYSLYGAQLQARGINTAISGSIGSIANRVSYVYNLHGPSISVDTMCSSSLTTVHLACQSLHNNDCEVAIAGGVNISIHPNKYLLLAQGKLASSKGRCETFGDGGNGYVPGEGVGAIILKPLSKAIADGNHIYGVIKATAVNHGGKTNGYTVPNPQAQTDVIFKALKEAEVNPRSISYIEAHGTGTSLGDPIEIAGLTKAFREYTKDNKFCAIGSVKSNIGHCESAAGIAGLTKVLLQMKHKQIVHSLHSKVLNNNIDFENTPFTVPQELIKWDQPTVSENGKDKTYPRRAGISAFGAGGSNAHIIIEEYVNSEMNKQRIKVSHKNLAIILLSASQEKQLKDKARDLIRTIELNSFTNEDLQEIAYTLQIGRDMLKERLGLYVSSIEELKDKLEKYLKGDYRNLYIGSTKQNNMLNSVLGLDEDIHVAIEKWMEKGKYGKLLELWAKGFDVDWEKQYANRKLQLLSLPTYPFVKDKYWYPGSDEVPSTICNHVSYDMIHPLLHRNTSDLIEQKFTSIFNGEEVFLAHHKVGDLKVMPGVVYLEMAREAATIATRMKEDTNSIKLKEVTWARLLGVEDEPIKVEIRMMPQQNGDILYEVDSILQEEKYEKQLHCTGFVELVEKENAKIQYISSIKNSCKKSKITSEQCYRYFEEMGIQYGIGHQAIDEIYRGEEQVLAKLTLPQILADEDSYVLHPSMMDAALQACLTLSIEYDEETKMHKVQTDHLMLPYALEEMDIFSKCTPNMWAYIRYNTSSGRIKKMDIDLCDQDGKVCVQMKGFSLRELENKVQYKPTKYYDLCKDSEENQYTKNILATPVWEEIVIEKNEGNLDENQHVVVIGCDKENKIAIEEYYQKCSYIDVEKEISMEEMTRKIALLENIDHIIWFAPDNPKASIVEKEIIEEQREGVLSCFRLIKALLNNGYSDRELKFTAITTQTQPIHIKEDINPTHGSVNGLVGVLGKEFTNWQVKLIDIERNSKLPVKEMIFLSNKMEENGYVYRGEKWYKQSLCEVECHIEETVFRQGGVYVVIGGAGGLGEVWSQYVIEKYKVQVIWIGRRKKDDNISEKIEKLSQIGPKPYYISADATDEKSLEEAYKKIKQRYGNIHGIIHSAIVLVDQSLSNMDEERFKLGLSTKVDVSVCLGKVFQKERLDFVIFFSSMISFNKIAGQSNYAAGSTFKDIFAHQLAREWNCKVKVINWGYWGTVGIVASELYRIKMSMLGHESIDPQEAMEVVEVLLACQLNQLSYEKINQNIGNKHIKEEIIVTYPEVNTNNYFINNTVSDKDSTSEYIDVESGINLDEKVSITVEEEKHKEYKLKGGLQLEFMDDIVCKILWTHLEELGLFKKKYTTRLEIKQALDLLNMYDDWLDKSIDMLVSNCFLEYKDNQLCNITKTVYDKESVWKEWIRLKDIWIKEPNTTSHTELLDVTLKVLPQILSGKVQATDVIFPNSSMELVEDIYKNNEVSDYYNEILVENLINYVKARIKENPATSIRIIEIGAGTGGTSEVAFEKLRPYSKNIKEYCYTDISTAFLLYAKEKYQEANHYLTYKILNIEEPILSQGFEEGWYDVVLATNVIHATKNIRNTLKNAKGLLTKNGVIMLNEISRHSIFTHMTFGLLEGWWKYEDKSVRIPGGPGLYPEMWKSILESEGFESVYYTLGKVDTLGQQIVIGVSNGVIRRKCDVKERAPKKKPATLEISNLTTVETPKLALLEKRISKTIENRDDFDDLLVERSTWYIKEIVGKTLKIPVDRMDASELLGKYGVDSIVVMQLTNNMKKVLPNVTTTLFFECQTIDELVKYFLKTQREKMKSLVGLEDMDKVTVHYNQKNKGILKEQQGNEQRFLNKESFPKDENRNAHTIEDVAIIGLAGRYPKANNVEEFWGNLEKGINCIVEIPKERWDWRQYFGEEKGKEDTMYTKWGGFIEDIDKFDPFFFNISPAEAERMDPQERLFLETAYACIEDAGYTPQGLSENKKVGVFVGVMNNHYPTGAKHWSIANRVSYSMNFNGPSMAVDTACSSSLTSIHLALESIHSGTSECAIAGGVNLIVSAEHYLKLSSLTMLSSGDKCKTFGEQADGFVDGEGVGAIILKPLKKAINDGDHIYGVIKGSSVNAGGKTNGYTVPNPNAQNELIIDAYKRANINARYISYIEAHGTGTALGDPIEIASLKKAFEIDTKEKQFCHIGSVKSNIGHCESAAGIAGVTKVLLQLKYNQLVPSLHSEKLNPNINFNNTPFVVQHKLEKWERLIIDNHEIPRISGVSGFGAGGANAHIIIQEYIDDRNNKETRLKPGERVAIVLSTRKEEQLHNKVKQLLTAIKENKISDKELINLAYTLQVGREEMEERLGFIVSSISELKEKLEQFIYGVENTSSLYCCKARKSNIMVDAFETDRELQEVIEKWVQNNKLEKIIEFWVQGVSIRWNILYGDNKPTRISLPTYPFEKESYWIHSSETYINPTKIETVKKKDYNNQKKKSFDNNKNMDDLKNRTIDYLKNMFSSVSKMPIERIETDVTLDAYGIDSIMIRQLSSLLESEFEDFSPTIFFEYQDIDSLAKYLMNKYEKILMNMFQLKENEVENEVEHGDDDNLLEFNIIEHQRPMLKSQKKELPSQDDSSKQNDIAIIGMSGRYPQAKDLQAFWENIKNGRDCVSEIPIERWDYKCYFEEGILSSNKINSKWGGFIQDVDKFDPLFFNVMPEEAERMDPQERLFLQCVYETIEDAGYTKERLRKVTNDGIEGNVGVYVGVTFSEYQFYGIESQALGKPMAFSGILSSIANRVSYYCNFNGPSMAIDSMCSSSLTALHVACESIKQGGCKMAVVGGVNLSLHPNKYLFLSQYNFLSSKGRCETFGDKGDGYVSGEGVGAILLKPLTQAEADGDHIYGVIKSTAINHGGKTNGYSVPNPQAQSDVIFKALKDANINPRSISYIEAHGTGTSIGDPIEIAGITKAFRQYTDENSFCAIGSVKSNIGHLEAAAAVAGITKVLLQMKYKQLVPSLHSEVLNTNIAFHKTPFKVQRELEAWNRPTLDIDGEQREYPRIAGVSSFGAGGANGHVIIEEYIPNDEEYTEIVINNEPMLIVLSARSKSQLTLQAERLLEAITRQELGDKDLIHIAYTLQVGRESMDERLGFLTNSINDLKNKLEYYGKGKKQIANCYRNQDKKQKNLLSLFMNTEELQESINRCIEKKKFITLIELWVEGLDIDWNKLYENYRPKRMSLPTYPFEQESYWHGIDTVSRTISIAENEIIDDERDDIYEEINSMILQPVWKKTEVQHENQAVEANLKRHIIFCELTGNAIVDQVKANVKDATCHVLSMKAGSIEQIYEYYGREIFKFVKEIMIDSSKEQVLVQLVIFSKDEKVTLKGLGSILKTARLENPKFNYQLIILPVESTSKDVVEKIEENVLCLNHREIKYESGIRYVHQIEALEEMDLSEQRIPWKEDGMYLITGGLGGLGLIFANEIADQVNHAKIILTGRSPLNSNKISEIENVKSKGAIVEYKQVDIANKENVAQLIKAVQEIHGGLDGIIHSAGVINDDYIINKTEEEFTEVFKPKVVGLMNLDACTKDIQMDFMVLFSSEVTEFGNIGQADYAAANAFMDSYTIYRNQLVKEGRRYGKTVTINWPLWESGGMRIDKDIVNLMFEATGMLPMKTETGINALYQALIQDKDRIMVVEGDIEKINQVVLANEEVVVKLDETLEEISDNDLREKIMQKLVALFGKSLKLNADKIDVEDEFDIYGVNSVKLMVLNQKLSTHFNNLPGTVFFENRTISQLGEYLIDGYTNECRVWISSGKELVKKKKIKQEKSFKFDAIKSRRNTKAIKEVRSTIDKRKANIIKETKVMGEAEVSVTNTKKLIDDESKSYEPIAIIGVSGRFPQADNIETFWDNLIHQRSCIKEIPEERWSLNGFYTQDKEEALAKKMSFSKWGGFLEGFADFDPLFFNISPAEASRIDPQERIFLEECWKAVEDAGYVPSKMEASLREKIGVFCGITKTGFNLWNNEQLDSVFSTSFASCVNRVSYFMDLMGPSVPVDTMCSSSLVAIHQGCKSIMQGECKMAIVGGVNLYTHPNNYVMLSLGGLISDKPKSSVFAKDSNGFTPSEGVGAVVLKKLSDAIKDNDHVWAVIKGSAIGHSGKTNGYNVPDPIKQAYVIQKALDVAEINPNTIGHIEVAASGSQLVDTIEMEAITKAFGRYRNSHEGNYTMSSVKILMGHGEAVSSMSQLIKALLQLKYKKICPTELPKECNPNIRWNALPFKIVTDQREWSEINLDGTVYPRRIGINSFGAGGVYAHVILEEYQRNEESHGMDCNMNEPSIFTFSAKNQEALKEYLEVWKNYLEENRQISLEQLAYILQIKREAMKRRFATVASDIKTLISNIEQYLVQLSNKEKPSTVKSQKLTQEEYITLMKDKKFEELAKFWMDGATIPWEQLYIGISYKQLPQLPKYPFRKRMFWINYDNEDSHKNNSLSHSSYVVENEPKNVVINETQKKSVFIGIDLILNKSSEEEIVIKQEAVEKRPLEDGEFVPWEHCTNKVEEQENNKDVVKSTVKKILREILYLDEHDEFDEDDSFRDLGLDSITMSKFIQRLNKSLELSLKESVLFDYTNTCELTDYIAYGLRRNS